MVKNIFMTFDSILGFLDLRTGASSNFTLLSIVEGESLIIDCKNTKQITFLYPKFPKNEIITSPEEITVSLSSDKVYSARFERKKAVYNDSGWYGCADLPDGFDKLYQNQFPYTPDLYNSSNVRWVYVFVKSLDHLFVNTPFVLNDTEGHYRLVEKVGNDVTLPCRPTSPKYRVGLQFENRTDVPFNYSLYDPTIGFVIKNISSNHSLYYICESFNSTGASEVKHFQITLKRYPEFRDVPVISTDSLTHMEIGKDFIIKCEICIYQPNKYSFGWQTSRPNNRTSQKLIRLNVSNRPSVDFWDSDICETQIIELHIKNVTLEDFGLYKCDLYRYPVLNSATVNLVPHERKHLELSMRVQNDSKPVRTSYSYTWDLEVDAYPLPVEFKWSGPDGYEISNFWNFDNYQVNDERFTVKLTKWDVDWKDTGTHVIFAHNSEEIKIFTFNVLVEGIPEIIDFVEDDVDCYSRHETVLFDCAAKGYPQPIITWKFGKDYKSSKDIPLTFVYSTNGTSTDNIPKVFSTAWVEILGSGMIFCEACNKYGCDWKVMQFVYITLSPKCCNTKKKQ
ncbi:macrophage colony-stimulating factor 1 receptor-like [Cotesia glomerata]|nr:macrophage colony-stimulating factor 1 receptor-like [Cotesia glomerata]